MNSALPKYEHYAGGMTMGEVFDQSISLYRRNFFTLAGILMRVYAPLMALRIVVEMLSNPSITQYESMDGWLSTLMLSLALTVPKILQVFLSMGLTAIPMARAVGSLWLGIPIRVSDAYRRVGPLWLSWLWTMVVLGLISLLLIPWSLIPVLGWLSGPALLLMLCLAVPPMLGPLIAFERKSGWSAIRRAWELVQPRFWWLLALLLAVYVLGRWLLIGPLMTVETFYIGLASGTASNPDWLFPGLRVIVALMTMLADVVFLPLVMTMMTLIYLDHRTRVDGLIYALRADGASPALDILEKFPAPNASLTFNRRDRRNLSALSALVIGMGYLTYIDPVFIMTVLFLLSFVGLL